ncbi:hypothetical protein JW968_07105 [Candidatus Woesearchaeota archaeon]|nr:hypothetical protein [Candidatus Woesearchaeota archaeon]
MRMLRGRRGLEYYMDWAEIFFFILLVIGFVLSLSTGSAFVSYVIIILTGLLSGRILHDRKHKGKFPYYLIIIGFLLGYLIGNFYANTKVLMFLFIVVNIFSYWLHEKGYMEKGLFS